MKDLLIEAFGQEEPVAMEELPKPLRFCDSGPLFYSALNATQRKQYNALNRPYEEAVAVIKEMFTDFNEAEDQLTGRAVSLGEIKRNRINHLYQMRDALNQALETVLENNGKEGAFAFVLATSMEGQVGMICLKAGNSYTVGDLKLHQEEIIETLKTQPRILNAPKRETLSEGVINIAAFDEGREINPSPSAYRKTIEIPSSLLYGDKVKISRLEANGIAK